MADEIPLNHIVVEEIKTLEAQGYDVSSLEKYRDRAGSAGVDQAFHDEFYTKVEKLAKPKNFAYVEPSDLASIKKARPDGPRKMPTQYAIRDARYEDKILGAWLGRCIGCQMGKPIESWTKKKIEGLLKKAKAWPLDDYFPYVEEITREHWLKDKSNFKGYIKRMARDDDIDYTILALSILEQYGADFTTGDVANKWLSCLQYHQVYTAERVAYRNLINRISPPETASYRNPFREWIGAQIRADAWGYVTPGWPEKGAEYAFTDASLTHTGNGIYGEMLFAAMLSAALVEDDLKKVIEVGLSEIPQNCRLAEAIKRTITWSEENNDWQQTFNNINKEYGSYNWVHTINNACVVIMGLMHGEKDFGKTTGIAVMGGWDTDCNGATAGSVLGAMLGADALPEKLVKPLKDTIESNVLGFTTSSISDLAARTVNLVKLIG